MTTDPTAWTTSQMQPVDIAEARDTFIMFPIFCSNGYCNLCKHKYKISLSFQQKKSSAVHHKVQNLLIIEKMTKGKQNKKNAC